MAIFLLIGACLVLGACLTSSKKAYFGVLAALLYVPLGVVSVLTKKYK